MLEKSPDVAQVLAGESRRTASRRRLRWIAIAAAAIVVVGGGWLWLGGAFRGSGVTYSTDAAVKGDIRVTVVATGTLQPTGEVAIASMLTGTIATVDVDDNDAVSTGQVLARLDLRDLDVAVQRASAMVDAQAAGRLSALATLADAQAALDRANALKVDDGVAERDVELAGSAVKRAQASLAAVEAQLKAAQADLQSARNNFDKATIRSPIDGVVYEVDADPGQSVATASLGQPLFRIAEDLHTLTLLVDIDEADVGGVSKGDTATFNVEAWPDREFSGVIKLIRNAASVIDGVVSYRAELTVDNKDLQLRPGMTATADINVDEQAGVLTVANAALRFNPATAGASGAASLMPQTTVQPSEGPGPHTVWVLCEGKPVEIKVTAGLSDGQRTAITGGELAEGDAVIVGVKMR